MTLKADDVQRKRIEPDFSEEQTDSGFKKSTSGFAQPGPQSPSVNDNSHCNNKSNLKEDEPGTSHFCMQPELLSSQILRTCRLLR